MRAAARGLALLVGSQFLAALADSALLVVALQALADAHAPAWHAPMLRVLFYGAYVLLAVFSGAIADAFAKRDVLIVTGLVKVAGCCILAAGVNPLTAYAVVGLGAVSNMPARYGILGETVAPARLIGANAWLEGATLSATLAGVVAGGGLLAMTLRRLPLAGTAHTAAAWLIGPYVAAVACCMFVTRAPAAQSGALRSLAALPRQFVNVASDLWADSQARSALGFTSIFWAVAAVLQFEVLRWAGERFGLPLASAVLLQLPVALGMIAGSAAAGRWATRGRGRMASRASLAAGTCMIALAFVRDLHVAVPLLASVGLFAGIVLVPANAVVQERGTRMRKPGEWLAVQHFAENAASLVLLAMYGAALLGGISSTTVILLLGLLVALPALAMCNARTAFGELGG